LARCRRAWSWFPIYIIIQLLMLLDNILAYSKRESVFMTVPDDIRNDLQIIKAN